jgi:hypothetical protein
VVERGGLENRCASFGAPRVRIPPPPPRKPTFADLLALCRPDDRSVAFASRQRASAHACSGGGSFPRHSPEPGDGFPDHLPQPRGVRRSTDPKVTGSNPVGRVSHRAQSPAWSGFAAAAPVLSADPDWNHRAGARRRASWAHPTGLLLDRWLKEYYADRVPVTVVVERVVVWPRSTAPAIRACTGPTARTGSPSPSPSRGREPVRRAAERASARYSSLDRCRGLGRPFSKTAGSNKRP